MSDEQISSILKRVVETFHQFILGLRVKVDHYIPAEDHMELPSEGERSAHKIEFTEDDLFFDPVSNGITVVVLPGKVVQSPLGGSFATL